MIKMEIFDWKIISKDEVGTGKFTLQFEVSKNDEATIRHLVNEEIAKLRDKFREQRKEN